MLKKYIEINALTILLMTLKIFYVGFSGNPGFPSCDILGRFYKNGDTNVSNPVEANVLIIGNFVQPEEIPIIANFSGIRVLYVAEPITKLQMCAIAGHIYANDICDYYIGCVSNGPKSIKYPFYAYESIDYDAINYYTQTCELYGKQFCTLINRHDWGNTRTPIFENLNQIYRVVCPGRLHNNCSNEEVDRIGNVEYIKKFIFNICSENFGTSHPGYITEKIKHCVLGGAIPVYYGALDDVDELVFNKNRICRRGGATRETYGRSSSRIDSVL